MIITYEKKIIPKGVIHPGQIITPKTLFIFYFIKWKPFKLMHCVKSIQTIMSFFIYPNKFDASHVHFAHSTENSDSKFHRLMYSTNHISLNNLGFVTHFMPTKIIHSISTPNKWIVHCDVDDPKNAGMIEQLRTIERAIIEKFVQSGLGESQDCIYSLAEHLNSCCMKTYAHHDDHDHFVNHGGVVTDEDDGGCDICTCNGPSAGFQLIVSIFGVWETRTECGIAYKFTKW